MGSGIIAMKNKVILIYKGEYDEIGVFTATRSEFLILNKFRCVLYSTGSGYEGEDDFIASKTVDLNKHSKFIDDCFSHIISSYENKENIVDCSGYGGTNHKLFQIRIIDEQELDPRLLNGEFCFKYDYEITKQYKFDDYYSIEPFVYSLAGIIPTSMWPNFMKQYIVPVEELAKKNWKEEEKKLQSNKPFEGIVCGKYPQSEVKDEELIKILNEKYGTPLINNDWQDYGYKANDYVGGYMFYLDVELDNNKYRGVYIKEFRPNTSGDNIARNLDSIQETNGYKKDTVYWFKFEPLIWVRCGKYNYQKQYLCLNVIDAEPMSDSENRNEQETGDYISYSLRRWLKETFMNNAFNSEEHPYINVDLLSKDEYLEYFPLKIQRKPRPTDYALIKGYLPDLRSGGNDFPFVWTSTYMKPTNRMVSISKDGSIIDFMSENHGYVTYVYGGVQPAFTLDYRKKPLPENTLNIDFNELKESNCSNQNKNESNKKVDIELIMSDDDLPF